MYLRVVYMYRVAKVDTDKRIKRRDIMCRYSLFRAHHKLQPLSFLTFFSLPPSSEQKNKQKTGKEKWKSACLCLNNDQGKGLCLF